MSTSATVLVFPCPTNPASRRVLRKTLLHALRTSEEPVIVDLSGCQTLRPDDIHLLLDCVSQAVGRDTHLLFVAGSRGIHVLLDVTRISSLVPVFQSLEEALAFKQCKTAPNIFDAPHFNHAGVAR